MALNVKIDDPTLPSGYRIAIEGLGVFENGKEREVTSEQEDAFRGATGMTVRQGLKNHPHATVGSETKGGD